MRVEQLGQTLGAPTKDLTLPLKKLLVQRTIRSEGHRRATRYFPAEKRGRARPPAVSAPEASARDVGA